MLNINPDLIRLALIKKSNECAYRIPYSTEKFKNSNCTVNGCKTREYAKGYCNAHYIRSRKNQSMLLPIKNRKRGTVCLACGKKLNGKGGWGLCTLHYNRKRMEVIKGEVVRQAGSKCQKCERVFCLGVYDFHHLGNKEHSISDMFRNCKTDLLCRELSKCIMLCANCHRELHYNDIQRVFTANI